MTTGDEAGRVLRAMWERIDARDWDGMGALLDPGLQARYVHTGETFGAVGLVALNREYPWTGRAIVDDLVAAGDRAVSRARVTEGDQTYHVASFATVRDSLITELVEVWTDGGVEPPADRRPAA